MKVTSVFEKLLNSKFEEGYEPTLEQQELLDEIVAGYYADEDICELLFSNATEDYDPDKLASFFSMLFWQTPDNGSRMLPTLEPWAIPNNHRKARVAHSNELEVVLNNVKKYTKP